MYLHLVYVITLDNIRPIRLPDANDPHHVNDIVTLTGWGRIRDGILLNGGVQ